MKMPCMTRNSYLGMMGIRVEKERVVVYLKCMDYRGTN